MNSVILESLVIRKITKTSLPRILKTIAKDIGDPHAERAGSHGFRRGYACDLAKEGGRLKEILVDADWRSPTFQTYISSVSDDLEGQALLGLLADESDSGED